MSSEFQNKMYMLNKKWFLYSLFLSVVNVTASSAQTIVLDQLKAFPTAEGAGAIASGGRGGEVYYVTTTADSGPGSLRDALLNRDGVTPRTVVFAVGGRFSFLSSINANASSIPGSNKYGDLTIAGQTANDLGGIHLIQEGYNHNRVAIRNSENLVIRYLSARGMWQPFADSHIRAGLFDLQETNTVIVDHYSGGYGSYTLLFNQPNKNASEGVVATDVHGVQHTYRAGDFTFQYSLGHEGGAGHNVTVPSGLPYSYVNAGIRESDREAVWQHGHHGDSDIHHNAFILVDHRQPFNVAAGNGTFVLKNNYTYGWGSRLAKHNGSSRVDYINNIFEKGNWNPLIDTKKLLREEFSTNIRTGENPGATGGQEIGYLNPSIYISGNQIQENGGTIFTPAGETQSDQWWMITQADGYGNGSYNSAEGPVVIEEDSVLPRKYKRDTPVEPRMFPVSETPIDTLKEYVLANVGAGVRFNANGTTYNVDEIDNKYINFALNHTDPATKPGIDPVNDFVYPTYTEQTRNLVTYDSDLDGMPNTWETANGLNPDVANNNETRISWFLSGYQIINNAGYTNLEMYLADISGDFHMLVTRSSKGFWLVLPGQGAVLKF